MLLYDIIRKIIRSTTAATASMAGSEANNFISRLPDDVLTSILFFLPLKDCVRTGILSSRWRNVWKRSSLRLDDSQTSASSSSLWPLDDTFSLDPWKWNENRNLPSLTPYQMSFFDRPSPSAEAKAEHNPFDQPYNSRLYLILSSHYGPVHSLRLSGVKGLAFRGTVTHLITRVIHRDIRELTLDFHSPIFDYYYKLPFPLYGCGSLQILTLTKCGFPKPAAPSVFPNLKELNLMRCTGLCADLLSAVLTSCMSLEIMQLVSCETCPKLGCVSVSSTSLRKFVLTGARMSEIKELIIENAPNLEYLMLSSSVTRSCAVKLRHATKLQVLGFISAEFNKLQLGGDYLVPKQLESTRTVDLKVMPSVARLSTVKTLAIDIDSVSNRGGMLARLLGCFSCIENLYIRGGYNNFQEENPGFWDRQGSFTFQDNHLKWVTIYNFRTDDIFVAGFARFLVLTSKVLDEIIVLSKSRGVSIRIFGSSDQRTDKSRSQEERETIQRELGFDKRASKDLKLIFCKETECISHVSLWEPLMDHHQFVSF